MDEIAEYVDSYGGRVIPQVWHDYQRPEKHGDVGWKGLASVPWRKTFEEVQADLDQLAEKKGWQVWNG